MYMYMYMYFMVYIRSILNFSPMSSTWKNICQLCNLLLPVVSSGCITSLVMWPCSPRATDLWSFHFSPPSDGLPCHGTARLHQVHHTGVQCRHWLLQDLTCTHSFHLKSILSPSVSVERCGLDEFGNPLSSERTNWGTCTWTYMSVCVTSSCCPMYVYM